MKIQNHKSAGFTALLTTLSILNLQPPTAHAQNTAFSYQGRLDDGGIAAHGTYDFRFRVDADPAGNTIVATVLAGGLSVTNGLFTTTLDFGPGIFTGSNYWLEVDVRTNGASGYSILTPLNALTPTPHAIFAYSASNLLGTLPTAQLTGSVPASQLSGTIASANLPSSATFSGTVIAGVFSGNGANPNLNAGTLNGLTGTNFWQLSGNTVSPGQFVGSTNNQPLEIRSGNTRAMRLEPGVSGDGAPNVIGGSPGNSVAAGVTGATIAGGGATNLSGIAYSNSVTANFGTVGGGRSNSVAGFAATIAGGEENGATGSRDSVGGGLQNQATGTVSTIAGGWTNTASGDDTTIAGGTFNLASGTLATVGGGTGNAATNNYATVPGGSKNIAGGLYSFAAGRQAQAINDGAFVWADSQNTPFASIINDSFNVRAQGGANFITSGAGITVDGNPLLASGYGTGIIVQQTSFGAPNIIEGAPGNFVAPGTIGATISGGGATNYFGFVYTNSVTGAFGTVGGGADNTASGFNSTVSGGYNNTASSEGSVVAGGEDNDAGGQDFATIGGGLKNTATSETTTVGGGTGNQAILYTATVAGGQNNTASGYGAFVGGGLANTASGDGSTIGGGGRNENNLTLGGNTASGGASTIPGGINNVAAGQYSFAAGQQAKAMHQGAFVWADSQNSAFSSTTNDQFLVRAQGGVGINTSSTPDNSLSINATAYLFSHVLYLRGDTGTDHNHALAYNGNTTTNFGTGQYQVDGPALWGFSGGVLGTRNGGDHGALVWNTTSVTVNGTFNNNSDRNAKQDFSAVTPASILDKVAQLPLSEWSYKTDAGTRHIGPMAQDFYSAFNIGTDDRHIAPIDEGGVALAAIQGINQKLETEVKALKAQNDALQTRLDTLERLIHQKLNNP